MRPLTKKFCVPVIQLHVLLTNQLHALVFLFALFSFFFPISLKNYHLSCIIIIPSHTRNNNNSVHFLFSLFFLRRFLKSCWTLTSPMPSAFPKMTDTSGGRACRQGDAGGPPCSPGTGTSPRTRALLSQ